MSRICPSSAPWRFRGLWRARLTFPDGVFGGVVCGTGGGRRGAGPTSWALSAAIWASFCFSRARRAAFVLADAADVEGLPPSVAEGAVAWGVGASGGGVSGRVIWSSKARRASTGVRRGRGDGVRGGLGSLALFASRNEGGRGGRAARSGDLDVTRHSRAGLRGGVRQPIARADASTLLCTLVVSRTRRAAARAPGCADAFSRTWSRGLRSGGETALRAAKNTA